MVVLKIIISIIEKKEGKLEQIPYIWYLVTFKDKTQALLDLKIKVNIKSHTFGFQLGLKTRKTNIGVEKINSKTLKTYKIVFSIFSVLDKDDKERFLRKAFYLLMSSQI